MENRLANGLVIYLIVPKVILSFRWSFLNRNTRSLEELIPTMGTT